MGTDIDINAIAVLLRAAHAEHAGALDRLIRACQPVVERTARRHAWSNTDPDDIVQEVWVRLIKNVARVREPRSLVAWLQVVTRRLATEVGYRNSRMVPTELEDVAVVATGTEEQAILADERRRVEAGIRVALSRLDETDRRLLLLLNQDGPANYGEVSQRVCRPVGSLGPTRRRLLNRLGQDPEIRRLHAIPTPA